jgi:hypothetical protein
MKPSIVPNNPSDGKYVLDRGIESAIGSSAYAGTRAMKLISTSLTETSIRMRYADHADPTKATQWFDFQVPLTELVDPRSRGSQTPDPLGDPNQEYLGAVRLAALRYVRNLVGDETQRLTAVGNRIF